MKVRLRQFKRRHYFKWYFHSTVLPNLNKNVPLVNMNEIETVVRTTCEGTGGIEEERNQNTANAAKELLKNGILVETSKGLVCMSLKDALNKGVGGHSFSAEDFQTVATKLLFQEEPESIAIPDTLWSGNVESSKKVHNQLKRNIKTKDSKCKMSGLDSFKSSQVDLEEFKDIQDSLLGFSPLECSFLEKNSKVSDCVNKKLLGKNTFVITNKPMVNKSSLIVNNNTKPVISVQKVINLLSVKESRCKKKNLESVLINLGSGTQESNGSNGETSDTSELTSATADEPEIKPTKKRGGWPKGRKRKPEVKYEIRPPKAPATGYVIFLNEKRKEYRDMPFSEVTKLLGNEWSKLSLQEKKVYLDQAEIEKKRYREELKIYRQSDAYQMYLNKKRLKRLQGNGTEESDMDATDEIDEEDNEELYCRSCDQWFHSLHNKREHLYGRQHLQSIAGRCSKLSDPDWCNPNMSSTSLDESSLDGSSYLKGNKDHCCAKTKDTLNMDDAIVRFMVVNKEREEERKLLKKKLEEIKSKNERLTNDLQKLKETVDSLTFMLESERTTQILLEQRLFNLLNVPTLFYLPEPLVEDNN